MRLPGKWRAIQRFWAGTTGGIPASDFPPRVGRAAEVTSIDFFGAPGRLPVEGLIGGLEERLRGDSGGDPAARLLDGVHTEARGRTWVTRKEIHIDRMASAWLIRRFIDPDARFKFVASRGHRTVAGEMRFDMFEAEFTHEGDRCTFDVLIDRFGLNDPALRPMAEIIHDIDLKDLKFERSETPGIDHVVTGISLAHKDDEARLPRGSALFDDLYEFFRKKRA